MDETEALIILTRLPYLGSVKIKLLIHQFGSAIHALNAPKNEIAELPGFGPKITQQWGCWKDSKLLAQELASISQHQARVVPYTSKEYPKRLLELYDHPLILYIKGEITPADSQSLSVIGTRQASIYGTTMAEKISAELTERGFTIVSGLARGIDTSAHIGALKRGRTIAFIGSGLANIYPQENCSLAKKIEENGALISEFPIMTPPDRHNFPRRNRLVSAMTLGTVLIEAPLKSGAMMTMGLAKAQQRKLFAIPGRADVDTFKGNHSLIKSGEAYLVENSHDIVACFGDLFKCTGIRPIPLNAPKILLDKDEEEFFKKLPSEEFTIDSIANHVKLPIPKLNVLIMSLILKKVVKEFPGKIFKKATY